MTTVTDHLLVHVYHMA